MNISPNTLQREMSAVDQIRAALGEEPDPKLLLDMIEGETSALDIIDALIEEILADQLLAAKGQERVERLEERAFKNRVTLLMILQDKLRQTKLQRPLATLSITHSTAQARVTNEDDIPREYWRTSIDMQKLSKALRDGKRIDGAELSNPRPVLRVGAT